MKRGQKLQNYFISSSEEDEHSSEENTENDEDYDSNPSDGAVFNVNPRLSKQRVKNNCIIGKKNGEIARQNKNIIRKNIPKRSRSPQRNGGQMMNLSKRKKTALSVNSQNDDQSKRKGSRARNKTDRLGTRESSINFNHFFENMASQRKASENAQNSSTTNHLIDCDDTVTSLDIGEPSVVGAIDNNHTNSMDDQRFESNESAKLIADSMRLMESKFDAKFAVLVKQCARIEAILKYHKSPLGTKESMDDVESVENVDQCENQLKGMGLPISEIEQLVQIEQHLNIEKFETDMVIFSLITIFYSFVDDIL